jgi:hypothetical protein
MKTGSLSSAVSCRLPVGWGCFPLQDARFEQRHFERRGGPRRQAKGKHGRPVFSSADRALIAIVYLRQICSQLVLSEMLEVSTGRIAEAITETGKVLAERRHRIEPTVLRFTSAAALRDFLATDTVPSRPDRLATLGNPALTGMSRPALAKLISWAKAPSRQRKHQVRLLVGKLHMGDETPGQQKSSPKT